MSVLFLGYCGICVTFLVGKSIRQKNRQDLALGKFLTEYEEIKERIKNGECLRTETIDNVWDRFQYDPNWDYTKHDSVIDDTYHEIRNLNWGCESRSKAN